MIIAVHGDVVAQTAQRTVRAVQVDGNQRIEDDAVRSYMTLAAGDRITNDAINQSLKALYATGLFADVTIRLQGDVVVVAIVENPIINRMAFEGNKRIEDEELETEVQLRPRIVYTRRRVQNDVQRITQLYRRKGRFAATVEPKIILLEQNRVDLVFEINEGPVTEIRKIDFIGNHRFSDGQLRSEIATKESRWYRFFTSDDNYDPDRLTFDRELLRRFYLSKGYADFQVVSAVAELTRDRKDFFITFTMEEGSQYRFGTVEVESGLKNIDAAKLKKLVEIETGEFYNADKVEEAIQALTFEVGRLGFAFVDIRPMTNRDRETRVIDVKFGVREGPRVYVDRIDIINNVRTLDEVVRREFRLAEGDAFNTAKLRESRRRINSLGFFDKVVIDDDQGLLDEKSLGGAAGDFADDRTVITVDVKEKSTGELSFGAGYSTSEALVGDVSIRERNLLGRGQDLRLGLNISSRRQLIDLSFTEPYFLDRDLAAGFDVFNLKRDFQSQSSYDEAATGGTLRAAFPIAKNLRQSVSYTLRKDTIENVGSDASTFVAAQEGSRLTSSLGYSLIYDVRDNRFLPKEGFVARFGQDLAGLGGDVSYLRSNFRFAYYYPFTEDLVGSFSTEEGYIVGLGERVRLSDRYFVGGTNFRGFESAGIGPRDKITGDALGGKIYYIGTTALRFPLGPLEEFGVTGNVFTEFGSLSDPDLASMTNVTDSGSIRFSTGFGVAWSSPFGPIQLDFTEALVHEDEDKKEFFRFSFGTRF